MGAANEMLIYCRVSRLGIEEVNNLHHCVPWTIAYNDMPIPLSKSAGHYYILSIYLTWNRSQFSTVVNSPVDKSTISFFIAKDKNCNFKGRKQITPRKNCCNLGLEHYQILWQGEKEN